MITEADKERLQKENIKQAIQFCEETILKAEKYERLQENKDWRDFIEDLKILGEQHDKQIKYAATMILDAPNAGYVKHDPSGSEAYVSSKSDWVDFMSRHEIEKLECRKWIKEPEFVISAANLAREKLPILKKKLAELSNEPVTSGSNGKS